MNPAEMVIDGSTIEKRRDQRAEQLETFLGGLKPEDRQGVLGTVNQWTKEAGARVVSASESLFDLNSNTKQLRHYSEQGAFSDVPPIVKRTPDQRLNSMVARLQTADPLTLEPILAEIAGEYWKAGAPVTIAALRAVAAHYLNKTERRK